MGRRGQMDQVALRRSAMEGDNEAMVIKLRSKRSGPHVHEDVFVGPDKDHMSLAGRLTFDVGQWQLFGAALKLGASKTDGQLEVVFEGDREVVGENPMRVKFLMIAEVEVGDKENPIDDAQAKLDAFRESVAPSQNYGITLYRVHAGDPELDNEPDILWDGAAVKEG